jgi:hypothetical protein
MNVLTDPIAIYAPLMISQVGEDYMYLGIFDGSVSPVKALTSSTQGGHENRSRRHLAGACLTTHGFHRSFSKLHVCVQCSQQRFSKHKGQKETSPVMMRLPRNWPFCHKEDMPLSAIGNDCKVEYSRVLYISLLLLTSHPLFPFTYASIAA